MFVSSSSAYKTLKKANERDEWKDIAWIASDGWAGNLPDNDDSYVDAIDGMVLIASTDVRNQFSLRVGCAAKLLTWNGE